MIRAHICLSPLVSLVTIPLTFYNAQFLLIQATCARMGISVPVVPVKQTHLQALQCNSQPPPPAKSPRIAHVHLLQVVGLEKGFLGSV